MSRYEFGFVGTGNMGGALARAAAGSTSPERIFVSNRTPEKALRLAKELGCACGNNEEAARESRFLMLGVKPQMMSGLLASIAPVLAKRTDRFVLVTMAAGLTMEKILAMAGLRCPVIRIMPNTPASIGQGMILCTANDLVTDGEMADFQSGLRAAGRFDSLDENLIDAGSAVSGCGPAFADLFAEALADGGVACGLPRAKALEYAAQMLSGAAQMILQSGSHPGALKDAVCSPAGSTIAGVRVLEQKAFRAACMDAVIAAYQRTRELGK